MLITRELAGCSNIVSSCSRKGSVLLNLVTLAHRLAHRLKAAKNWIHISLFSQVSLDMKHISLDCKDWKSMPPLPICGLLGVVFVLLQGYKKLHIY